MKRDLDLVRNLLEIFEREIKPGEYLQTFKADLGHPAEVTLAHIELMINQGLLEGFSHPDPGSPGGGSFAIKCITWAGHDFLDAARSDTVWNAAKARLKKAGSWTFGLLLEVLKDEAKRQLGSFLP